MTSKAIWEIEFLKCHSIADYRDYIDKYKCNPDNPFVKKAMQIIDDATADLELKKRNKTISEIQSSSTSNDFNWRSIIGVVIVLCFIGLGIYIKENWRDWTQHPQTVTNIEEPSIKPIVPEPEPEPKPEPTPNPELKPNRLYEPEPEYITENVWVPCFECHGSGRCPYCDGDGWDFVTNGRHEINSAQKCPVCYGNGTCQSCHGNRGHYEMQTRRIR